MLHVLRCTVVSKRLQIKKMKIFYNSLSKLLKYRFNKKLQIIVERLFRHVYANSVIHIANLTKHHVTRERMKL